MCPEPVSLPKDGAGKGPGELLRGPARGPPSSPAANGPPRGSRLEVPVPLAKTTRLNERLRFTLKICLRRPVNFAQKET